jgi:DNA-binding transcriptional MocR family regulator
MRNRHRESICVFTRSGPKAVIQAEAAGPVLDIPAPDSRFIPFEDLLKAFRGALLESARGNRMGYGDPHGLSTLRSELATMLRAERGLNAEEDTLCVVRGSQMGIYLVAKTQVRAGDRVAMERLSYPPAREAFRACGGLVHSVEQDECGMIPEDLERVCRSHGFRAISLTPHHQVPTTVTMPIDRRMRLLALAEQFDFVVIEDDYDHEIHFSQPDVAYGQCGSRRPCHLHLLLDQDPRSGLEDWLDNGTSLGHQQTCKRSNAH